MDKNIVTILVVLAVGFAGGYGLRASQIPESYHMMQGGDTMRNSVMGQNIDQHFIVQMIPHHEGAIEMAKIALKRSKRQEIISLANGIIEAQQKEINDMSTWYKAWFGSTVPQGGTGMMQHIDSMEGDTSVLQSISEANFDREFLQQMIPHHEMAIMMAGMLQYSTERNEMKILADNIITSQAREIEMMRSWLTNWYKN